MAVKLSINGKQVSVSSPPGTPLLWVIRDELDMTGTKFGCGIAACGACTVHVNGEQQRSCSVFIEDVDGASITTIEGVTGDAANAVQTAWRKLDVVQCGYCQSGQIMSAVSLLEKNPKPSDDDINAAMGGNACRCATYVRIRAAIHHASKTMEG
ncbi:MAG: (2Fe-2S)-binding protein [Hyphomicrobiaceae bacterium]